uniref:N-acylethanolamine-hydrolyzing acid amidase n=1 Tax=Parascaris univalens TaxID=6257 RepID=A0A915CDB5_PARUN
MQTWKLLSFITISLQMKASRRGAFLLALLMLTSEYCCCDRAAPRYRINLDLPPEQRWNEVIDEYSDLIPAVIEEIEHYIPRRLRKLAWWLCEEVAKEIPEEFVREMQGIADRSGLRLGEIIGLNILYDISTFNFPHIIGPLGCTSIVAENEDGIILHGRNLDYEMTPLLRNGTLIAEFTRDDKVIYTAVTFFLYVGVLTGQRPNAFAITLNSRNSGGYIDNILMEIITRFRHPISFSIRKMLEENDNYYEVVDELAKIHFVAPSYLIVSGIESGQGCVITRDRWTAADIYNLNVQKGRWFLVETNFDHWKIDRDKRRYVAERLLNFIGRSALTPSVLSAILSEPPISNK